MNKIGIKIRQARKAKGMKQADLAKLIGISNTTISGWENGTSRPDVDMLEKLCGALDVSPNYFFGIEDNSASAPINTDAEAEEEISEEVLQIYNELHELLLKAGYIKPGELLTPKQGKALIALINIIDLAFDDSE